jgi:hypothetical protein
MPQSNVGKQQFRIFTGMFDALSSRTVQRGFRQAATLRPAAFTILASVSSVERSRRPSTRHGLKCNWKARRTFAIFSSNTPERVMS